MSILCTLLDYGAGNLHSLGKALERAGAGVRVTQDPGGLLEGDAMVLPGVGAFGAAAEAMAPALPELRAALDGGFPCLGICLGMQLLFDESEESEGEGLGAVPGRVRRLRARRVPHMGWNTVDAVRSDPVLQGTQPLVAYFANSYAAYPDHPEDVVALAHYEAMPVVAAVRRGNTWGFQFHPEKSGERGLDLIRNWVESVEKPV